MRHDSVTGYCRTWAAALGLLACCLTTSAARVPPRPVLLSSASEQRLFDRVYELAHPAEPSATGRQDGQNRAVCGTPLLLSVSAHWPNLSKPAREAFAQLLQRPARSKSALSTDQHFRVHYDVSGPDGVDVTDLDANGVPDYVDEVGRTFEAVLRKHLDELGYEGPVDDGDGHFDVYIGNLPPRRSVYGLTWPESFGAPTSAASMEIDNDYKEAIYQSRGLDGLHVTAAHEFHHAIQFAYFASDLTWWHELTATWMEEVMYPQVNDYLQYVDTVLGFPPVSLDRMTSLSDEHIYGASLFGHYLADVYGPAAIRRSWETLKDRNSGAYRLADLDAGMPEGGFAGVLPGYTVWNFFTGSRARPGFYPDGDLYPTAAVNLVTLQQDGTAVDSGMVDHLAADYVQVPTGTLTGGLRADFTLEPGGEWQLLVILTTDSAVSTLRPSGTSVSIDDVGSYDEVVFVPVATASEGFDHRYHYELNSVANSGTADRPLALGVAGNVGPVVAMDDAGGRATVTAQGAGPGATITWGVKQVGGDVTIAVPGQSSLTSFQTQADTIQVVASAGGTATVEITASAGSGSRTVMLLVFSQQVPASLAAFGARAQSEGVTLHWSIVSQTNNAGWRMLRSTDGLQYDQIGAFVLGAGTSDAHLSYSVTDDAPPPDGVVYYRLEQVDLDGTVHLSDPVAIAMRSRLQDGPASLSLSAFPNPFNPQSNLAFGMPRSGVAALVVYNTLGQTVRHLLAGPLPAGRHRITWNGEDDAGRPVGSGIYIARLSDGTDAVQQKLLLLE